MNELRDIDWLPSTTVDQLQQLCGLLKQSLPSLTAVILHDSAATAGFEPHRSDLDVLVIVEGNPDERELERLGRGMLSISNVPHPIELSVVTRDALTPWRRPCHHVFHFGEDLRERFESGRFLPESDTDDDLTMHLVVARARGLELTGRFSMSKLPEVPRADYLAAICGDFEWAENQTQDLSDYVLSNACRTLAFLRGAGILSKTEGRQWCAEQGLDTDSVLAAVGQELERLQTS